MSSLETKATYTSQRSSNLAASITTGQLWGRILYKEARPLIPLLLSLAILSLLGHVLVEIQRIFNSLDVMYHAIPYAMNPILFALGAAALLVSQEKEQRTLLWYSSLPIAPRTIVQSKIVVGLVGIALSWIVSLCIALPFTSEVLQVRADSPADILYVIPMTALFVFGVTFGLGWIFGSAIPALLSLIPVVVFTILTASLIARFDYVFVPASVDMHINSTPGLTLIAYAITLGTTSFVAWKVGSRSFVAPRGRAIQRTASPGLAYRPESNFFSYKRSGETGALLWHAWMQNRTMIIAMIVAALAGVFFANNLGSDGVTAFSVGSYALLVCWVGTMAFGADQHLRRVHFLAERGVSPAKVWASRLAVPFGVLVLLALTVLAIDLFDNQYYESLQQPILISCVLAGLWSFAAIAIAAWWGQLGFSRVVSLCGAPLSVLLLMAYYASVVSMFIAPIWLVLLMLPIPFLATRISMRAWMDRRFTVSYYVRHGVFLLAACLIPVLPFGWRLATVPRMSSANREVYMNEYQKDQASQEGFGWSSAWRFDANKMPFQINVPPIQELLQQAPGPESGAEFFPNANAESETSSVADASPGMATASETQQVEADGASQLAPTVWPELDDFKITKMELQLKLKSLQEMPPLNSVMEELVTTFEKEIDNNPAPLRYSYTMEQIATDALLKTYHAGLHPGDELSKKRWEGSVRLLGKITKRLRSSLSLVEQNQTDALEQSLLQILRNDTTKKQLDPNLYRTLVRQIADTESRKRSRRRAILHSWQYDTNDERIGNDKAAFYRQLGGMDLYGFRHDAIFLQTMTAEPIRGYVVDLLVQLASSSDPSIRQVLKSELERILSRTVSERITSGWHGDWEKQAEALAKP